MSGTVEDRRFFVRQYVRTLPLNAISVFLKAAAGAAWALLDNAKLLGFFALASAPSSISQRATIASALAQATLPNVPEGPTADAVIRTAAAIDFLLMLIVSTVMVVFFTLTRAEVVSNLGFAVFLGVTLLSLVETVTGSAVHVCNARRHYVWNCVLVNSRIVALLILLAALRSHGGTPFVGVHIWVASTIAAFAVACFYFWRTGVHAAAAGGGFFEKSFLGNVKSNLMRLSLFQIAYLLFGSIPSIVLAYLGGAQDVGLFSFALTLSAFVYAGLAPVNEQIFSPTFSRLVNENDRRRLVRRVIQMQAVTLALGGIGSVLLFFGMAPLLRLIHKVTFLGSYRFLPLLLVYQVLLMCGSGFTYPLFCMNRFKALAVVYGTPAIVAFAWVLWARGNPTLALRALPISSLALNVLGAACLIRLVASDAPLLRRSLVGASA